MMMTWTRLLATLLVVGATTVAPSPAPAEQVAEEATERWRVDAGLTVRRFEQQFKVEVGGARGERLVQEQEVGLLTTATWRVWGPFSAGAYLRLDAGTREASRFTGFDEDGKATVAPTVGGDFTELWVGPLVRAQWRTLFAELGYGALGLRDDDARGDLTTADGDTSTALRTLPTVAWIANFGGGVPLTEELELVLRLEYRVRYYDRRGSDKLRTAEGDEVVHGTQNLTPFVGVAWRGLTSD
jgi:hypothetical protein